MLVVLVPVAMACEQDSGHNAQTIRQQSTWAYNSYSWRDAQEMKFASDKRYIKGHNLEPTNEADYLTQSIANTPLYQPALDDIPIFMGEERC
jgi:hypothetical protein